jgi:hypothetical protein
MRNEKEVALEKNMPRIQALIDGWSIAERRIRIENLKAQLTERGMIIDHDMADAAEKFASGSIGFDELFKVFQYKYSGEWLKL